MELEEDGANAYNNAVFILNDICQKQYSNKELGTSARSINLEDIEQQMTKEANELKYSYNNGILSYGDTQTCSESRSYYPSIYAQENESGINLDTTGKTDEEIKALTKKDGIGISESWYSELTDEQAIKCNKLTVTQTYYKLDNIQEEYLINKDAYDVLFSGYFWIASRYVDCSDDTYADFGVYLWNGNSFDGGAFTKMYFSWDATMSGNIYTESFRPIVTLNKDVKINPCIGTNDYNNMHTLSK